MELAQKTIDDLQKRRDDEKENQDTILNSDLPKEEKKKRLRNGGEYFKLERGADGKLRSYLASERL